MIWEGSSRSISQRSVYVRCLSYDAIIKNRKMSFQLWQWIVVGVGLTGAVIVGRSIRLATRFENATSIPEKFFDAQVSLHGRVKSVESDGILRIAHVPIIQFPWKKGVVELIRVKIAGVRHTDKSISYLQRDLIGEPIFFKLLGREDPDIANCIVRFRKGGLAFANLNMYLVKTGRAKAEADPSLVGKESYDNLAKKLKLIEQHAQQKSIFGWFWNLFWKPE